MPKKLKMILASIFVLFNFAAIPALVGAAPDCKIPASLSTADAIQCGTCQTAGVPDANCIKPGEKIDKTVNNVINLLSIAVGIAAVIMLIIGSFRYITSSGNQESIKAAKNTITYALIGLVIVALAQLIVNFVLNKTTQA